jgi:hypothetical protein
MFASRSTKSRVEKLILKPRERDPGQDGDEEQNGEISDSVHRVLLTGMVVAAGSDRTVNRAQFPGNVEVPGLGYGQMT